MICKKCGNHIDDNDKFCGVCGTLAVTQEDYKGNDSSLPSNNSFILTILFMCGLIFISIIILSNYEETHRFIDTIELSSYKFKVPLGFKGNLDNHDDSGEQSLLIQNDDIIYEFLIYDDYYKEYTENNFYELKSFLDEKEYKINVIDEIEKDNHKMTYSLFKYQKDEDDDNYYSFYMSKIKNTNKMVWGYIYKNDEIDIDDIYKALDIVNNIE